MPILSPVDDGVEIRVKVVPGASKTRIAGPLGDALKIQVAAPPERGKANQAVEALLARSLGVPAKRVVVVSGMTSPQKTVRVLGVTLEAAQAKLSIR